jgi:hypothetical protein
MSEIVKVQRPLSSNDMGNPWLIYDEARKHVAHMPEASVEPSLKAAMGSDAKGYFLAVWSGGGWKICERVKAPKW